MREAFQVRARCTHCQTDTYIDYFCADPAIQPSSRSIVNFAHQQLRTRHCARCDGMSYRIVAIFGAVEDERQRA